MHSALRTPDSELRTTCVLRAENLTKKFFSGAEELTVLEDLNLEVPRSQRLAIIGESGAGKTTLLQILGALDSPSSGEIYFNSQAFSRLSEEDLADFRNREIGFVWQFHCLLAEFTAQENVAMPLRMVGVKPVEAEGRAAELLDEVGLSHRRRHFPGELSGGEQQRVALARALVSRPSLLLADEPTGNLDGKTAGKVFDLIEHLHQTHRLTSILVTHNPFLARRCDSVKELRHGRLETLPQET